MDCRPLRDCGTRAVLDAPARPHAHAAHLKARRDLLLFPTPPYRRSYPHADMVTASTGAIHLQPADRRPKLTV